ncbi:MAG: 50S ribosomal protein L22 [Patescibacteria group bacterium]|nr:50S ribosomal protein L22 [Patescibacteria group bacterium]MDD5715370.1 50S ribosomal protein L22 [Patescibacteria group bacterium]
MEVTAKLNFLRMSPRKVRLIVNVVRGMDVERAEYQLHFMKKAAALPVLKLLKSAIANAENNNKLKKENLFIKRISVDEGPALKRWEGRAFGRASMIRKRSSHVAIVLDEKKPTAKKASKQRKSQKETRTGSATAQKAVSYDEIKHEAKGKEGAKQAVAEEKKGRSMGALRSIKDKFTRRLGER